MNTEKSEAIRKLNFLDGLLGMGEEAWEIEYEVRACAQSCSREFVSWVASKGVLVPAQVVDPFIDSLFINVYLVNWKPRASLARLNKPMLLQYFEPFTGQEFRPAKNFVSPYELLSLFFRFLSGAGYELSLERLLRAIKNVEKETRRFIKPEGNVELPKIKVA